MKQPAFGSLPPEPVVPGEEELTTLYDQAIGEDEEGYDPHEEHREYERLKAEYEKTKAALEEARKKQRTAAAATQAAKPREDWKRAIVLAEILGKPRSRKRTIR